MNIGIVVSEFHFDICMAMLEQAKVHAKFLGVSVVEVATVPGVYDMPVVVKAMLERKDIDGVVALGAVIEGETEHDEVVMQHAARKLTDLAVQYGKPVGMGITGPGMSRLQAESRISRAKSAVETVIKLKRVMDKIKK